MLHNHNRSYFIDNSNFFYCMGLIAVVSMTGARSLCSSLNLKNIHLDTYTNQLNVSIEKKKKPFGFMTFSFTCSFNMINAIVFETIVSDTYGLIISLVLGFIIELIGRICKIKWCHAKIIITILYWYIQIGSRLITAYMFIYFITLLTYCFHYRPLFD